VVDRSADRMESDTGRGAGGDQGDHSLRRSIGVRYRLQMRSATHCRRFCWS